jgi:hypothetical protein
MPVADLNAPSTGDQGHAWSHIFVLRHKRARAPTQMSQWLLFCDDQGTDPLREGTANITQIIGKLKGAGEAAPQYEEGAMQKNSSWACALAK